MCAVHVRAIKSASYIFPVHLPHFVAIEVHTKKELRAFVSFIKSHCLSFLRATKKCQQRFFAVAIFVLMSAKDNVNLVVKHRTPFWIGTGAELFFLPEHKIFSHTFAHFSLLKNEFF